MSDVRRKIRLVALIEKQYLKIWEKSNLDQYQEKIILTKLNID